MAADLVGAKPVLTGPKLALEVQELTKCFGDFCAVDHVSFSVRRGEVIGYLGPNGSGKTTTIRMLCGLLTPSEGTANVMGFDINQDPEGVKTQIGYMSQKFGLYDDLTARENLEFYAGVYEIPEVEEKERIAEVIHMAGLDAHANSMTSDLSGGWRQRLALGCAMLHRGPAESDETAPPHTEMAAIPPQTTDTQEETFVLFCGDTLTIDDGNWENLELAHFLFLLIHLPLVATILYNWLIKLQIQKH